MILVFMQYMNGAMIMSDNVNHKIYVLLNYTQIEWMLSIIYNKDTEKYLRFSPYVTNVRNKKIDKIGNSSVESSILRRRVSFNPFDHWGPWVLCLPLRSLCFVQSLHVASRKMQRQRMDESKTFRTGFKMLNIVLTDKQWVRATQVPHPVAKEAGRHQNIKCQLMDQGASLFQNGCITRN